jgi:hypothetical protein
LKAKQLQNTGVDFNGEAALKSGADGETAGSLIFGTELIFDAIESEIRDHTNGSTPLTNRVG